MIDDAAVTPQHVLGFAASRELPIVGKIAAGSLRFKLLILPRGFGAPASFLPWIITRFLRWAVHLCYEGVEKLFETVAPHYAHARSTAEDDCAESL